MSSSPTLAPADVRHFWHPFTQMQEYSRLPRLNIVRGEGCWLYDEAGHRYLDANASIWTNTLGHNDPELNAAITTQLERIAHSTSLGLGHPAPQQLAARLADLCPGTLNRVFYSDNGSNAVEIALKLSLQYWQLTGQPQRRRIIAMTQAYHGDTFGTMAVGDCGGFHARFAPWFFSVERFAAPRHQEAGGVVAHSDASESLAQLRQLLDTHDAETACLILEPWVQGAGGMRQQPPGFVKEVASLCQSHGVHLILDEVFVGFGRLGPVLTCAADEVEPDFLCLAKGLTGGYLPLAATVTRDAIYEAFLGEIDEWKAFYHGHTFTGNPLGCAVSLANITKLEALIASGKLPRAIEQFSQRIRERCLGHAGLPVIRQRGLTACLELPQGFPVNERVGMQVALEARQHGLILRPLGDSLLVVPPLVISEQELDFLFDGLLKAVESVLARQPHSPLK